MQLQYLETLKQVGSSPSSKLVVPMELANLLNGLRNMLPIDGGRAAGSPSLSSGSPEELAGGGDTDASTRPKIDPQV